LVVPNPGAAVGALRPLGDFVLRRPTDEAPHNALLRDPDLNKIELTLLRP
jgi:hypothetical protein